MMARLRAGITMLDGSVVLILPGGRLGKLRLVGTPDFR